MKKLLKNKTLVISSLGILLGIVLVLLSSVSGKEANSILDENNVKYTSKELESYTSALEKKVTLIIDKIGGVSNVSVALTIDASSETVYATEGNNKDYVILGGANGIESALKIMEINATVRGIAVVCNYGGSDELRIGIINMLSSLFDIGANRISVISA
jgi:hypothetical protein